MRQEQYQGVIDSVATGIQLGGKVGTRIYLPATFIGGPRDMKQRFQDSMTLVQEYGKPDIFLTMTCNPNFPEIKELLEPDEEPQNCPDLTARVFKAKLSILNDKIMSGEIFGEVLSVVHVVEFQKRGLPHAHFLIILKTESKYLTPEAYDRIVCAELPDKHTNPYLYGLVSKHMMHGPCGKQNPSNVCMRDGLCKNKYPKDYTEYTMHGKGSYPIYRRRNDGRQTKARGKILDNRWVIPYNPTLVAQFDCHINVEICCDIRVVKYLYKYVHKGHDKVMFRVTPDESEMRIDEIKDYQNARWVSLVEAAWRIFGYPLSGMYPSVILLQVHLPNYQSIHFFENADLEELLRSEKHKRTMLTEFFEMNAQDPKAYSSNLLYKEFPKLYVWDNTKRIWTRRKKRMVIGRLCTVNPIENKRYYLRILLNNVRKPTSFESLLTIDGVIYETFKDAAYKRGLLQNDGDIEQTLEEATLYRMPIELRRLLATILIYCKPSDPSSLFKKFYTPLAEDFNRFQSTYQLSDEDILYKVLQSINDTLESMGTDVNEFRLCPTKYFSTNSQTYTREILTERNIPIPDEDIVALHKLNKEQRQAFDLIYNDAVKNQARAYFINGLGGTEKSYLYKVILAHLRAACHLSIIVASSGIAASNFLGGRNAHSRFKISLDAGPNAASNMSIQGGEAKVLKDSKIIIWDEAPMAQYR